MKQATLSKYFPNMSDVRTNNKGNVVFFIIGNNAKLREFFSKHKNYDCVVRETDKKLVMFKIGA